MAPTNVLTFDYSIDNEIAQNATKHFVGTLEKVFEQYKKLWNEYLKLRKHCEDCAFDIPFKLFESDEQGEYGNKCNKRKASSDSAQQSTSMYESVCHIDVTLDADDTGLNDKKSTEEQREENLLKSPIFSRKRFKSKRTNINDTHILTNFEENITHPPVPIKENIIFTETLKGNIVPTDPKGTGLESNNHEIKSTHVAGTPNKLSISTLYNIDTTLLEDGKKLKQTKIVMHPDKHFIDTITTTKYKKSSPLKSHVSPTPKKNIKGKLKKDNSYIEDDIIENSPKKSMKPNMKMKKFKLIGKSPKNNRKQINMPDTHNNKSGNINLVVKENNQSSLSQFLLPVHTSTQKEQPLLIQKTKMFGSCDESIESNCDTLSSPSSPVIVNIQDLCHEKTENSILLSATKKTNQVEKGKCSGIEDETDGINFSTCNDETFCPLSENIKKKILSEVTKQNVPERDMTKEFESVKKSLMNSFDMLPEKKELDIGKPSKKRSERAKMSGVSCWECKKYYANLGLSENEIKARRNQCSRHRTKFSTREGTPEGFWDPVFPDTCSTTFQDN